MKTELRFKEKQLTLSNQEIIELAYTTKEIIEYSYGGKLFFEQANCYSSCFYTIRNLIEQVDQKYLDKHKELCEFYRKDRELSNDFDRLQFVIVDRPRVAQQGKSFADIQTISGRTDDGKYLTNVNWSLLNAEYKNR